MKNIIMPYLARIISSDTTLTLQRALNELKRKAASRAHTADVFLQINDPYSYLLVQVLPEIEQRYRVTFRLRTICHVNDEMFPEQELWQTNAFNDALRLAELYKLLPPKQPMEGSNAIINGYLNQLVKAESSGNTLDEFSRIFSQYWQSNESAQVDLVKTSTELQSTETIKQNEALLDKLGHYMGAMIYFGGEWYWGIDRLDHFERRANGLGLCKQIEPTIYYQRTYSGFCSHPKAPQTSTTSSPLTLYFSIRSPYSHIGLERAVTLARHYNVELIIKPVLPMVMRGLAVPNAKKMYIFHDTKREAKKHNIDYGYVADPLGAGVERCYALFDYASRQGKSVEYMLAYARAVNAQGVRSETDSGLKRILSSCGLDWGTAQHLINDTSWVDWAEKNLEEMYSYGLWGVPSFKFHDTAVWGQDRIFVIENEIIKKQLVD